MGRIVMDPATGIRYRRTGNLALSGQAGFSQTLGFVDSWSHSRGPGIETLEPLPRVGDHPDDPKWPGSFPEQYLHRGGDIQVQVGDLWLVYHPIGSWVLYDNAPGGEKTMQERIGDNARAYLIRRADVTHDWDEGADPC